MTFLGWTVGALAGIAAYLWPGTPGSASLEGVALPPQTVVSPTSNCYPASRTLTWWQYVNPLTHAVHSPSTPFRGDGWMDHFNPTNTSPPFFQAYHPGFLKVIGSDPSIRAIATNPGFAFAHEAPIWVPETDELFFSSQNGGYLGFSDWDNNNQVGKLSLSEGKTLAAASGSKTSPLNATVTPVALNLIFPS